MLNFAQKKRHLKLGNNEVKIIDDASNELICLSNTKNAKLAFITSKMLRITKCIIENCENCTIVFPESLKIMTSMIEVTNSNGCTIVFDGTNLRTIQCDNSQRNTFLFNTKKCSNKGVCIIWSEKSIENSIQCVSCNAVVNKDEATVEVVDLQVVKQFPILFEAPPRQKDDEKTKDIVFQYRTKFIEDEDLETVIALREGAGYVTSADELKKNEEKSALFEQKIQEFISKTIKIEPKKPEENKKAHVKPKPASRALVEDPSIPPPPPPVEQVKNEGAAEAIDFQGALDAKKANLNAVETKVTSLMDMVGNAADNYHNLPKAMPVSKRSEEYFDSMEKVVERVKIVADHIRAAKHVVVYTGAGISTSANLPDYRGPQGAWTLMSQGIEPKAMDIEQAFPTYSHYAIRELMKRGLIHFVTSTNVDGLHRRSGIPEDKISELHGNCYREVCSMCNKEYLRGFDTTKTVKDFRQHITGRKCDSCGGNLKDTIIHFSETLPVKELKDAATNAAQADLALVLGTSMLVNPAAELPAMCLKNQNANMVIVNLQKTPYDAYALKIYAKTDEFMQLLMKELGIEEFDQQFDILQQ